MRRAAHSLVRRRLWGARATACCRPSGTAVAARHVGPLRARSGFWCGPAHRRMMASTASLSRDDMVGSQVSQGGDQASSTAAATPEQDDSPHLDVFNPHFRSLSESTMSARHLVEALLAWMDNRAGLTCKTVPDPRASVLVAIQRMVYVASWPVSTCFVPWPWSCHAQDAPLHVACACVNVWHVFHSGDFGHTSPPPPTHTHHTPPPHPQRPLLCERQ